MAYNIEDLRNFYEKDTKTQISILVQSAFNKAVDFAIAKNMLTTEYVALTRDEFFKDNLDKIEREYQNLLLTPQQWKQEQLKNKEELLAEPTIDQAM